MKQESLVIALEKHAGTREHADEGSSYPTMVEMLRPFDALQESVLESVLGTARELADSQPTGALLVRGALAMLEISSVTRSWALDQDSMLVRNRRINDGDHTRLTKWVREVEELTKNMLERSLHAAETAR